MRVRFTRDSAIYESDVPFLRGQEVNLPSSSVERWMRRGAIELIADAEAETETPTGVEATDHDAEVSRYRAPVKRRTR